VQTQNLEQLLDDRKVQGNHRKTARMLTYIRPLLAKEGRGFGVFSEHGNLLAKFDNRNAAYFTARQFHLKPQLLH
jgi:hypothetical protein